MSRKCVQQTSASLGYGMYIHVSFQSPTKEDSFHKHIERDWLYICPFRYSSQVIDHLRQAIASQAKRKRVKSSYMLLSFVVGSYIILCITCGKKNSTSKSARPFITTPYQHTITHTRIISIHRKIIGVYERVQRNH